MAIKIGDTPITQIGTIKIGNKDVQEVWVGATKVWPAGEPIVPCGTANSYTGGNAYPSTKSIQLGSGLGTVTLEYNSSNVPDRFIVKHGGNVVIDTGYVGSDDYDYKKSQRNIFTYYLTGKKDPITGNTYPDTSTYSEDGYPRIVGKGRGTTFFDKTSTATQATVEVFAPIPGTVWNFTLGCPT